MNEEEMRNALLSIEMIGIRVNNGADYYICPACFNRADTMGFALTSTCYEDAGIGHAWNCPLRQIRNLDP